MHCACWQRFAPAVNMSDDTVRLSRVIVRVADLNATDVTFATRDRSYTVPIDTVPEEMRPLLIQTHLRFFPHLAGDELLVHNLRPISHTSMQQGSRTPPVR